MRGALCFATHDKVSPGIIPAYAGSTVTFETLLVPGKDHPRVCGEHMDSPLTINFGPGSSPRMRGAQGAGLQVGDGRGIIPAYAGSTEWVRYGIKGP